MVKEALGMREHGGLPAEVGGLRILRSDDDGGAQSRQTAREQFGDPRLPLGFFPCTSPDADVDRGAHAARASTAPPCPDPDPPAGAPSRSRH